MPIHEYSSKGIRGMKLIRGSREALALVMSIGVATVVTVLAAPAASASPTALQAASATDAPASETMVTATIGEPYCTPDGAAVDVSFAATPAQAGIALWIEAGGHDGHGQYDGMGLHEWTGTTAADGTAVSTVPVWSHPEGFVHGVSAGYNLTSAPDDYRTAAQKDVPVPECGETPTLTLSASTVAAGGSVTVVAAGFAADEEVTAWLHSTPVQLWAGRTDADGAVSQTVTIAADTEAGAHRVELRGASTGSLFADLTVTRAEGAPTDGGDSDGAADGGSTGASTTDGGQIPTRNVVRAGATGDVAPAFAWSTLGLVALTAAAGLGAVAMNRRVARVRTEQRSHR